MSIHTEKIFEEAIELHLLENGYIKGNPLNFNKELAIDTVKLLEFIKTTQAKEWEKLSNIHQDKVEHKFLNRLSEEINLRGKLDVIRKGIIDYGVKFHLAYFKPESNINQEHFQLYNQNIISVTRQLKYSLKNENSIDMVIFLNGLPIFTIELKNQLTNQNVDNAKTQYMVDRDSNDPLLVFKKGALVHFAVDTDEVYMSTKLEGSKTRYLPFNKGDGHGAGNPINPDGYKSSYFWEEVLQKDSFLDLIGKFIHLQVEEFEVGGKKQKKEKIIFPRYHQLDVVRKISQHAKISGVGNNYLIQHSAGSGKSNSIAWLAYRLFSLHDNNDNPIFNSVIVITDRKVLDQQLQDNIYQFDHKRGVVEKIDKNSTQLAETIKTGGSIIITTLQKFPFIFDKIGDLPNRKYAVIIDEAHSSQGGVATQKMKQILGNKLLEDAGVEVDEDERTPLDEIEEIMNSRGKQANLSFFAFTATPKQKTLGVFGVKSEDGTYQPFHLYSMKQAIEEGFIYDVLKNYMTYKTFYKVSKSIEDDPQVDKKKAGRAIARFLSLHPHNLAQKTEVIIEHFRQVVSKKIGGKAKAMVVTGSRLHAVRYKQEFDRYIKENNYIDIKALVAFSGVVNSDGLEYTEAQMNGFGEKELPKKFDTPIYGILIVADKYQTGFDQPLLHTMYVDKKLNGIKAVQTLSRLNRTCPGKEDTFILDFLNDRETILKSFQPYYELTSLEENPDPNHLYNLRTTINNYQIIWETEIENFCNIFFKANTIISTKDQAKLHQYLDPAVDRYKQLEDEAQEEFKHSLTVFTRLYSFLSQIMPFSDIELEKLYTYGRYLLKKLPRKNLNEKFKVDDEIALEYYRLQKIKEGAIELEKQGEFKMQGITDAGMAISEEEKINLSEIIKTINDKYGTEFTEADRLFFEQIEADLLADRNLQNQAKHNPIDTFKYGFEDIFLAKIIERMENNQEIFDKIMDDKEFAGLIKSVLLKSVYNKLSR